MPRLRHLRLVLLCGLVMGTFALRATTLEAQSLWRDEVDALCYAFEFPHSTVRAIAPEAAGELVTPTACPPSPLANELAQGTLTRLVQALGPMIRHNGPLYYFLLRGWIVLAGWTPFALRYLSLLAGVLIVPLVYALGKRMGSAAGGQWAAALAACSPYFIWYSQDAKMYTLITALAVLAIYALHRALYGSGRWWVVMVVATSLCMYLHILTALLIPLESGLLLVWMLYPPHPPRHKWLEALLSLACLTLPYLPLLTWQLPLAFQPQQTGYPTFTLAEMVHTLAYGFAVGVVGHSAGGVLLIPLALMTCVGVVFGAARWPDRLALALWIVWPILALALVSTWRPMFTDRYLIWIGPAWYLLAALGLAALWRYSRLWVAMLAIPLAMACGWGVYMQAAQPVKSDFRAAAHYVDQRAGPDDLFIFQIPHVRYTFDYYYPRAFLWADGLYTNYGMSDAQVDAQMRALIGDHRQVWLIASEMPMWDQNLQVFNWLESNARRVEVSRFMLVDVYRYQLP